MKIKRITSAKEERNLNGIKYEKESMGKAIAEYLGRDDIGRSSQEIIDYKLIQNTDKFFSVDASKVIGTVTDIDDDYVYITPIEQYENVINPSDYQAAFRMVGESSDNGECIINKIIAVDLIKNNEKVEQ